MSTSVNEVEKTSKKETNDIEQPENEAEIVEIVPGYASFDDYVKNAFSALKCGVKAANGLPAGENFNYYSCFPKFNEVRNTGLRAILNVMQGVVELSGAAGNMRQRDADERFDLLVEANDIFLDRANVCMDEEEGISKTPDVDLIVSQISKKNVFGSWNATTSSFGANSSVAQKGPPSIRLLAARNIQRPQLSFKDKIDNSSKPWQPRIKDKPNSLKPLALYLEEGKNGEVFNHPYEVELDRFEPPESQLEKSKPRSYKSLEETLLIMIEKPQDVQILLEDLRRYDEIAVDLEHHSYRTYQGITCLMQISTRDTDYLIDTLSLRSELHLLNEIFTNRKILKVFHGADSDIHWLQRDLSVYVVNMFDTHQAAKQLDLQYLSLAFLMKRYCNVDPNKHFQLADWRIRPLPEELMKYAREDTHYLLYIKDILRNELVDSANGQTNILRAVYDRSTDVCRRVYEKPVWTEDSYMSMYRKSQKMFNNRQLYALRELHKWRDDTARQEDDSTGYVLPNHMLLNIAETLPREMQGILACCNPIPPLVRQNLLKLHKFILRAREQPLIKPVLEQDIRQRLTQRNQEAANVDGWNFAPHDVPANVEVRTDLPCLLNHRLLKMIFDDVDEVDHVVTVFDPPTGIDREEADERRRALMRKKTMFVSPFERYKRVMPMVAAQEEEERKREERERAEASLATKKDDADSTMMSIERVHEHFKTVVGSMNAIDESPRNDVQVPLGRMHGRKRKRQSDVRDTRDHPEDSKYDVVTTKPSLEATVTRNYAKKRKNNETSDDSRRETTPRGVRPKQNHKKRTNGAPARTEARGNPEENAKRLSAFSASKLSKKEQKRANRQELQQKGMLPQKNFDYASVDFSSFQGGSTTGSASTNFQQPKQKDRVKKGKRRRKQKISGI